MAETASKLGRVAIIFKGDWDKNIIYENLDMVRYGKSSFICTAQTSKGEVPNASESWTASAGGGLGVVDFVLKDKSNPDNTVHTAFDLDKEDMQDYSYSIDEQNRLHIIHKSNGKVESERAVWYDQGKLWITFIIDGDSSKNGYMHLADQVMGYFTEENHYHENAPTYEGARYNKWDRDKETGPIWYTGTMTTVDGKKAVKWTPEDPAKGKEFTETYPAQIWLDKEDEEDNESHLITNLDDYDPRDNL